MNWMAAERLVLTANPLSPFWAHSEQAASTDTKSQPCRSSRVMLSHWMYKKSCKCSRERNFHQLLALKFRESFKAYSRKKNQNTVYSLAKILSIHILPDTFNFILPPLLCCLLAHPDAPTSMITSAWAAFHSHSSLTGNSCVRENLSALPGAHPHLPNHLSQGDLMEVQRISAVLQTITCRLFLFSSVFFVRGLWRIVPWKS